MVVCIIALVVFSVLGIFSARYRALAEEAFECVFRKVTFRPCATNLNQKIRAKIVAKIFMRSPKTAGMVKKYFEPLSIVFAVLMISSAVLAAQAGYNIWKYGTCTPSDPGSCVVAPHTGKSTSCNGSPNCTAGCLLPNKTCAENCTCRAGTCG